MRYSDRESVLYTIVAAASTSLQPMLMRDAAASASIADASTTNSRFVPIGWLGDRNIVGMRLIGGTGGAAESCRSISGTASTTSVRIGEGSGAALSEYCVVWSIDFVQ